MAITKYKTKKGEFWMLNVHLGTDPFTGVPVRITRRGFLTKKEAEAKRAQLQYEFDHGTSFRACNDRLEDVYKRWLPLYSQTVKASTLNKTNQYFESYILPRFGKQKIESIRPIDCQDFATELSSIFKDYRKIYSYAIKLYDYAYTIRLTEKDNPFRRIIFPKNNTSHKVTPFLDKNELGELLHAMEHSQKWHTFFYLLAYTGIRRGEALALTWDDVDIESATLTINKTVTLGLNNAPYISEPKTIAGTRVIDLDEFTISILRKWKQKQKIISLHGFVFPNEKGGFLSINKPYQFLQNVLSKNQFRHITIHSFRHTHCSMLFEAGWDIKDVQERLGHRDIQTTMNIYTHVTNTRKQNNMKKLVDFIASKN